MPEIKHNFTSGKMNKDLDERLVPNGEYRDALNLQVSVSEGSDVGAIENILGNHNLSPSYFDSSAKCIASIADEKLDTLYWFTTSAVADRITEYNVRTGAIKNVIIDSLGVCLKFNLLNRIITGVNIIDGMLFWTDNTTEPKKINIQRCIAGTVGSSQTLLVNTDRGIGPGGIIVTLEESHITVIRKSPKNPLSMTPKTGRDASLNYSGVVYTTVDTGVGVTNGSSIINSLATPATNYYDFTGLEIGEIIYLIINTDLSGSNIFNLDPTKWAVGKKVYLKEFDADPITGIVTPPAIPTTDYRIRAIIEPWGGTNSFISNAPANSSAAAWPASQPNTAHVKLKILSIDGYPTAPSPNINGGVLPWAIDAYEDEQNLFEFKFPRFSYRYKYEDGEYSTFAPFSNIAFRPGSFDYHIKKGYNLGMTNRLISIDLQNFITQDMPEDVVEIDILYKEDGSPNIYVVETFSPVDEIPVGSAVNNWSANQYTVTSDTIYAILPANQLLRPWDNVPRKTLSQEIVGNRIVYANYIQNFDLKSGTTSKEYYPDFSVAIGSFVSTPITAGFAFKSIKTLREYQLGVVFIDEYGRETPVLSNETGTLMMDKVNSASQNRFDINFQAGTQFPQNMKYMKFFVKETSGEYYNLAMGRYYDAEDGNIWLSFPSTDRAKLDEESFIILKKGSDSNIPVIEPARYKVIAIENDAPDFIKTVKLRIDTKVHSYVSTGNDLFGTDMSTAPGVGDAVFEMRYNPFASSSSSALHKIMREAPKDQIWVDFTMSTSTSGTVSNRYRVTELTCDWDKDADGDSPDYIPVADAKYFFKIEGIFGDDVNFICDDPTGQAATQINEGAQINIYRYKVENRPQFDGRFFAKILNDDVFRKYVSTSYASLSDDFKIVASRRVYSLHDSVLNKWAYQFKMAGQGKYNPTPEIAAFLYNYDQTGNSGPTTINHQGMGWHEGGGYIGDKYLSAQQLYGPHEHIRHPDKNRYQAWFNEFRFFDTTDAVSDFSSKKNIGSGGIQQGAQHVSSQFDMSLWPSPTSTDGSLITVADIGSGIKAGGGSTAPIDVGPLGEGIHNAPYGWTFEIGESESQGYISAVDFNQKGTYWFIDGARKKGFKNSNLDMNGAGGVGLSCLGASTSVGSSVFPITDSTNGFYVQPGTGPFPGGIGDPGGTTNGCIWEEANGSSQGWQWPVHTATGTTNNFGHKFLNLNEFTINLGFGGLYDDQWQVNYNAAGPQYYSALGFFDLRGGGNTKHPLETDFISKLVPGSRWRWAEDPEQTHYVIGGAVEEHGCFRYCMLPHDMLQVDEETDINAGRWRMWGGKGGDHPGASAVQQGGYNAVSGFTNPANFTKNFIFNNEDSNENGGYGWLPIRKTLAWNDTWGDKINNNGYNISVNSTAAGTTAFNFNSNLDNYYITLDTLVGTNTGGGAGSVAIHKGLVLWYVASGLNDAGENEATAGAFGVGNAVINLGPSNINLNYPTGAGTFWDDMAKTGSASDIRWQALLVKKVEYDSTNNKYKVYLTGYRRTMTKYDTIVPANNTALTFRQPKMNGFSPNFVDNFHWMAWKWNNDPSSPWDPANYALPYAPQFFGDGFRHFEHGSGFNVGEYPNKDVKLFDAVGYTIEILEPLGDLETYADDPAIWETEPREVSDLNIYYEASGYNPMVLDSTTKYTAIPTGSTMTRVGGFGIMPNTTTTVIGGINDDEIQVNDPINGINSICVNVGGCPVNGVTVETLIGDVLEITRLDGSVMTVTVTGFPGIVTPIGGENFTDTVQVSNILYNETYSLNWHNCYSYGNGVESNRIRDYFNLPYISNGVFVSATLGEQYKEERRNNGLIYSGLYNSISGINNLNQFIQAEKITKDINPSYGSIQKLHTRDTDLVTLCEDKILRILANKDAVFNADGNPNLTATANVLGQAVPFVGEYGISTNPESFASESYRAYFSDRIRGAVLRLSKDGLTPISDHGMKDWFKDNLKIATSVLGSYDDNKDQYNITLGFQPGSTAGPNSNPFAYNCDNPWSNHDSCATQTDLRKGYISGVLWTSPNYMQLVAPYGPLTTTPGVYHNLGGCGYTGCIASDFNPLNLIDYIIDPANGLTNTDVALLRFPIIPIPLSGSTQASINAWLEYTNSSLSGMTIVDSNTSIPWTALDACCQRCRDNDRAVTKGHCFSVMDNQINGFAILHPAWAAVYADPTLGNAGRVYPGAPTGTPNQFATWDDVLDKAINVLGIPGVVTGMDRQSFIAALDAHYGHSCTVVLTSFPCLCCSECGCEDNGDETIEYNPDKTLTFKENVKGWVSFKSFIPEHAVSCANEYFTFNAGNLYQHHHNAPARNNFYGQQYQTSFKVLINDGAGSVKNFQTVNYEGSNTRIRKFTTQNVTDIFGITTTYNDMRYDNLVSRPGWWIQKIQTDLQQGGIPEFIEKEGKWFNYIKGPFFNDSARPQFDEFAAQGIGGFENFDPDVEVLGCMDSNSMANYNPLANVPCQDVNGVFNGTAADTDGVYTCCEPCAYGCMDSFAPNYDPNATCDDGSCAILGCTDPAALNYDPTATWDDGSCVYPVCGCMDGSQVLGENASLGNGGGPTGVLVDEYLNFDPTANCDCDCDCTPGNDTNCCIPAIYGCMQDAALNFQDGANIQSNVPCDSYTDSSGLLQWQYSYCDCLYPIYGCTDSLATNFDNSATVPCDLAGDGPGNNECCIYPLIPGCPDADATNYDPDADGCADSDGIVVAGNADCCTYIYGCMDSLAMNYNPAATVDDGSCVYCVYGCMDTDATNWDANATCDDGSCIPVEPCETLGCTNPLAYNYDPTACIDDGSCDYCQYCPDGCDTDGLTPIITDPNAIYTTTAGDPFTWTHDAMSFYTDATNGISGQNHSNFKFLIDKNWSAGGCPQPGGTGNPLCCVDCPSGHFWWKIDKNPIYVAYTPGSGSVTLDLNTGVPAPPSMILPGTSITGYTDWVSLINDLMILPGANINNSPALDHGVNFTNNGGNHFSATTNNAFCTGDLFTCPNAVHQQLQAWHMSTKGNVVAGFAISWQNERGYCNTPCDGTFPDCPPADPLDDSGL